MSQTDLNFSIAEVFIRCLLGILFLFQGYDKLFVVKIKNVVNAFHKETDRKHIPEFLLVFTSYFTSITEFFGGILLITGVLHQYSPILLAINLLIVAFAFSFLRPMWDMQHVFPRVVLLTLTLLLSNYFYFGLDTIILNN
ncbi:MAG TPA: DoxX family membrane protein [Bacteroidia bacterium]|nr:DoxX family membrane protein [Bacteroidia bacterium]